MRVLKFLIFNSLLAIYAVSIYLALYSAGEYKFVEEWMWAKEVPLQVNTLVFLAVSIFVGIVINYVRKYKNWVMLVLGFVSIGSLFIYYYFRQAKTLSISSPKIFSVNPKFGIQAQIVEIKGIRFTPPLEKGQVLIDGIPMNIKFWDAQKIVAEQPVLGGFGTKRLEVMLTNGNKSNQVDYEVRDPRNLEREN